MQTKKQFALVGVGGYIAPRHLQAIKDTGNNLAVSHDVNDSVGVIDRYFMDSVFYKKSSDFENYLKNNRLDYLSICSPNFKHKEHILLGLQSGLDIICEKPLVLTTQDWEDVKKAELKSGRKVNTVLQLRIHPALMALKQRIDASPEKRRSLEMTYITSRGSWYHESWKGMIDQSGGLAFNIGIHLFDMLTWIFGECEKVQVNRANAHLMDGELTLKRADIKWKLSIDHRELPKAAIDQKKTTYRSLMMDGEEIEFSEGFTDLHTQIYKEVLAGRGFGLDQTLAAIKIAELIRGQQR